MVVLYILLWILVGIGSLVLLVVLLPFRGKAEGGLTEGRVYGGLSGDWAWGFLSFRYEAGQPAKLYLAGLRVARFKLERRRGSAEEEEKKERKKREKAREKKEKKRERRQQAALRGEKAGLARRDIPVLVRMARRMVHPLAIAGRVEGTLGTDDPGDTALIGEALRQIDRVSSRLAVDVQPSYVEEVVELEGEVRLRVWIAQFLVVTLGLLLSRENRRVLRAL